MSVVPLFRDQTATSEDTLAKLAVEIRTAINLSAESASEAGRKLIEAKAIVGHAALWWPNTGDPGYERIEAHRSIALSKCG